MIYGQSGGGSKVTTLMGMPSAAGLFHRASVQSGGGGNPPSGEQSREFAKQVMVELGWGHRHRRAAEDGMGQIERGRKAVAIKMNPPRAEPGDGSRRGTEDRAFGSGTGHG